MTVAEQVRDIVVPVLSSQDLELYDLDVSNSLVRVAVHKAGGVDLEALGAATRAVSRALDDADPIAKRYTLEVTSPGLERALRTPEQFAGAIGEVVKLKTRSAADEVERLQGELLSADGQGVTIRSGDADRAVSFDEIDKARTVFEWGSSAPPKKRERNR